MRKYSSTAQSSRSSKHRKTKYLWWFQRREAVDRYTGWLMVWTALLTVVTLASVGVLVITDMTLRDSLEANNRAWIAVSDARLDNSLGDGLRVLAHLNYKNIGQSPALNVNHLMMIQKIKIGETIKTRSSDVCELVYSGPGTTLFPGIELATTFPFEGTVSADSDVIDGKAVLYWRGCFRYETYKKMRTSQFCFWLRHDGPKWYWNDCGIYAD